MRYAISSHQATVLGVTSLPYLTLRSAFESLKERIPALGKIEGRFNRFILRMCGSALNEKLVGPKLFDAVELHLTDPRIFYNTLEWIINENAIKLVRGPISSFHAHVEISPLLKGYGFNLCETSPKTRKAIRSQIETAYRIMHDHSDLIVSDNPVFVFHGGLARNADDREKALDRTRENIEYIAGVNEELYRKYGGERKLVPTMENGPRDKLALCQTVSEWKQAVAGFGDAMRLTLDYGHLQTVKGEKEKLLAELQQGTLGEHIANLHLHYSPQVGNRVEHAHAALSKIPADRLDEFRHDLSEIMRAPGLRRQGYVTLEVPSGDLLDYIPSLVHLKRGFNTIQKWMQRSGLFEFASYRGTIDDQLAGLAMAREIAASITP